MQNEWSGERLETFIFNDSTIEHLHRYAIVKEFVQDKIVLDIACGEGYGSNLLSATARAVNGVDKDEATINHASVKYKRTNLSFKQGSVEKIPFAASTFDVVVSLETLEHISDHASMMAEIKRVLKPGGMLLISTPDKRTYSDIPNYKNPFHKSELYKDEFEQLLNKHFQFCAIYHQNTYTSSLIFNPNSNELKLYDGDYHQIKTLDNIEPLYFVGLCSDIELPFFSSSIFTSKGSIENALREKELSIKSSYSYRLGHTLLWPAKFLSKMFRKNN